VVDELLFRRAIEQLGESRQNSSHGCKICGGAARPLDILDLNKACNSGRFPTDPSFVPVIYWQCRRCFFVFTNYFDEFSAEEWQAHIYNENYLSVDPDFQHERPLVNVRMLNSFLFGRKQHVIGLDYGAGNGRTALLMREAGWIYDSFDPYGYTDVSRDRIGHYNFCSAIEVFEHLTDPIVAVNAIVEKCDPKKLIIMIGTGVYDREVSEQAGLSWWYAAPRNGHVSLYSSRSFEALAARTGLSCNFVKSGPFFLTKGYSDREIRRLIVRGKVLRRWHEAMRRLLGHTKKER